MAARGTGHRRILVGAGSYADARAALAILERLAGFGISDIGGVFLEDRGMMEAAAPGLCALVSPRGALRGVPSRHGLRRMWQSDARAFREQLMQLAARQSLRWSFERLPGDPVADLCGAAQSWDWLLIGHLPAGRHAGKVVGIAHEDGGPDGVAELTGVLAQSLRTGVELIPDTTPEVDILSRVGRLHAAAVVVDAATGPFRTSGQIRALLDVARCPVLVLGAGRLPGLVEHSTQIPQPPDPAPG
ncbi:hypothetical protein [Aquicoccus sp. SU-CL01552]|uniref:hypothetical protein n=1 Tax=Aquicoccus sp. SU-CL01552 TaxID=3127656 RepID=UPI003106CC60